jgi:hypothetical protein
MVLAIPVDMGVILCWQLFPPLGGLVLLGRKGLGKLLEKVVLGSPPPHWLGFPWVGVAASSKWHLSCLQLTKEGSRCCGS